MPPLLTTPPSTPKVNSAECTAALVELARLLQVPTEGIEPQLLWRAVARLVRRRFAPAAINAAKLQEGKVRGNE